MWKRADIKRVYWEGFSKILVAQNKLSGKEMKGHNDPFGPCRC